MKLFYIFIILLNVSIIKSQSPDMIYLWPGNVPGEPSAKKGPVEAPSKNDNVLRIATVTDPAMQVFPADASLATGVAVIVCPGGGYNILAYDKEGTEIAQWLNKLGVSAFVLQYRVPQKREGALQDLQRAIRLVKNDAARWKTDPGKIGVIGFSAGGSLCARAGTLFSKKTYAPVDKADSLSCRPSFAMLIYPAYLDQGPGLTLTPELSPGSDVPPMFIFQTADDTHGNSALTMAGALRKNKIPVELHLMPRGGHGYGLRPGITAAETWPLLAEKWMKDLF